MKTIEAIPIWDNNLFLKQESNTLKNKIISYEQILSFSY
jgi:hypothetical protein